jgi:purine-binding chemotaxis protein CheW
MFATEETYLRRADARVEARRRGLITFLVSGELYGVDILAVREIIKLREITEVPRVTRFLLGVVTVRGVVVPVIDLRARLRLTVPPPDSATRILIVVHKGERFGMLVDEVRGVVMLSDPEIEPLPASFAASEVSLLSGIGRYRADGNEQLVVLVSLEAVLDFDVVHV